MKRNGLKADELVDSLEYNAVTKGKNSVPQTESSVLPVQEITPVTIPVQVEKSLHSEQIIVESEQIITVIQKDDSTEEISSNQQTNSNSEVTPILILETATEIETVVETEYNSITVENVQNDDSKKEDSITPTLESSIENEVLESVPASVVTAALPEETIDVAIAVDDVQVEVQQQPLTFSDVREEVVPVVDVEVSDDEDLLAEQEELARREVEAQEALAAIKAAEAKQQEERRRRAGEQQNKRNNFLSQMGNFSQTFETKSSALDQSRLQAEQDEGDILTHGLKSLGHDLKHVRKEEVETNDQQVAPVTMTIAPIAPEKVATTDNTSSAAAEDANAIVFSVESNDSLKFNALTSSLFSNMNSSPSSASKAPSSSTGSGSSIVQEVEEEKKSDRDDLVKLQQQTELPGASASAGTVESQAQARPPMSAEDISSKKSETDSMRSLQNVLDHMNNKADLDSPSSSGKKVTVSGANANANTSAVSKVTTANDLSDSDDDSWDGEYDLTTGDANPNPRVSHFLSKQERKGLSAKEKVAWKAKQADMTDMRKDFHGAVTYAFDGVFSWQMYGSAEAIDEMGRTYTEYLMRCQWGTSWDNLQPWISARRYREFDALDAKLRTEFRNTALPVLIEKDYFRFLESDVIAKRRRALEVYMTTIVSTMPLVLRSEWMDEFLGISERIVTIKRDLKLKAPINTEEDPVHPSMQLPPGIERELGVEKSSVSSVPDNSKKPNALDEDELRILSVDDAEEIRRTLSCLPLDEDILGRLEEDIRDLCIQLRGASIKDAGSRTDLRRLLISSTNQWPQLRATCELCAGVDFTLIPRALQAEEDLIRAINDYRSLVATHKMVAQSISNTNDTLSRRR